MARPWSGITVAVLVAIGLVSAHPADSRADRITLRGGGEIKGVILKDASQPAQVLVLTESASRPVTFRKDQILAVVREPGALDDYVANREKIEQTPQAQHDFGLWCEEQKLTGPALSHFQKAIALDPQFGPAHKKLGHVLQGSRWLTYDEQREAQGLVKYKGKWISRAKKEKVDARVALSAEQSSWASRLKLLRRKLYDADPNVRQEAESQIAEIRDPAAIPGLLRAFGADEDAMRIRLGQILGAIEGPSATDALVQLMLAEFNADVRQSVLDELARRRDPQATTRLLEALKLRDPVVVGHAAWALAATKADTAVPKIVEALFQSEKRVVMVEVATPSGGLSGSFGFSQNLSGGPSIPADSAPGFGVIRSQPVVTAPVVGPGVVAYGVTSVPVPAGTNPIAGSGAMPTRMVPTRVTVHQPNAEVLKALESLTGVNLGFDQAAWRRWISTSFRPTETPRRVPQP